MQRRYNVLKRIDWLLVAIYLVLLLMGWVTIYSTEYNEHSPGLFDVTQKYGKQFIWIVISLVFAIFVMAIDGRFYISFAYVLYGLIILLLIAVLLFGQEVSGSKSWFQIGGFKLQPAEFAKFSTNLALAKFITSPKIPLKTLKQKLTTFLLLIIPMFFIVLQGDAGSALVYFAFILVLFREGLSPWFLVLAAILVILFIMTLLIDKQILVGVIVVIGLLSIWSFRKKRKNIYAIVLASVAAISFIFTVDYSFNEILKPHQRNRINVLLHKEVDTQGAAYNVRQSQIAIGSGGLIGRGFLQGTQTKYDFVPEQSTDFIFSTIGEEKGFVGSSIVIVLFLSLLLRIIHNSEKQRSKFSRVYGYGVAVILFFHFAVNVGMTIGLAPVIGIPFPFFSYGGSSLLSFTILLFIFIKLDSERLMTFH